MDVVTIVVAIVGGALVTWGSISLIFFMIYDVWPFQPHSIAWLPGGWNEPSRSVATTGRPVTHG